MTVVVKQGSSPREIATFLTIAFTTSWVVWILGIRFGAPPELLIFGAAGPALAAAVMQIRQSRESTSGRGRFAAGVFLLLAAVGWAAQVLSAAARTRSQSLSWHPLLLLAAVVAALLAARLYASGDIRPEWSRWCSIAVLSMPAFLLIPAAIAHFTHLPVVQPRPDERVVMTIGVSVVLFTKEFLFAGLLEESGWRGWLLPRLQQRWSPLVASLIVWLPWALWHAPLDFSGGAGSTWMNYIQVRVVFFIAISVLLTWFFNHSGGSIIVVALFHAAFNTFSIRVSLLAAVPRSNPGVVDLRSHCGSNVAHTQRRRFRPCEREHSRGRSAGWRLLWLRGLKGEARGGRDGHQIVVAKAFWIEELESVLAKTAPVAGEPEATLFAIRCRVFQRQGQPAEVFGQPDGHRFARRPRCLCSALPRAATETAPLLRAAKRPPAAALRVCPRRCSAR